MITCEHFIPKLKGCLQGFATIFVEKWGVCIKVGYFIKGEQKWISLPSEKYEKDGETKYSPQVWLKNKDHKEPFTQAAVEAIEKFRREQCPSVFDGGEDIPF